MSYTGKTDYSRNYGVNPISSSFMTEESFPDATSEKELVGVVLFCVLF
jgi:hypothetical protein